MNHRTILSGAETNGLETKMSRRKLLGLLPMISFFEIKGRFNDIIKNTIKLPSQLEQTPFAEEQKQTEKLISLIKKEWLVFQQNIFLPNLTRNKNHIPLSVFSILEAVSKTVSYNLDQNTQLSIFSRLRDNQITPFQSKSGIPLLSFLATDTATMPQATASFNQDSSTIRLWQTFNPDDWLHWTDLLHETVHVLVGRLWKTILSEEQYKSQYYSRFIDEKNEKPELDIRNELTARMVDMYLYAILTDFRIVKNIQSLTPKHVIESMGIQSTNENAQLRVTGEIIPLLQSFFPDGLKDGKLPVKFVQLLLRANLGSGTPMVYDSKNTAEPFSEILTSVKESDHRFKLARTPLDAELCATIIPQIQSH